MALFVAKLLESTTGEIRFESSPKEALGSFKSRLETCLKTKPQNISVAERRNELEPRLWDMYVKRRGFSPDQAHLPAPVVEFLHNCSDDLHTSIEQIKALLLRDEQELQERKKSEAEQKNNLQNTAKKIWEYSHLRNLNAVSSDLKFLQENVIVANRAHIDRAKYLEAVGTASKISSFLHSTPNIPHQEFLASLIELQGEVNKICAGSRAKAVMMARFSILKKTFVDKLLSELTINFETYEILSHFRNHSNPFFIEQIVLQPEMDKFKYHFERVDSALNLLEKPDWPLRKLFEIAQHFNHPRISLCLARKAREHFNEFRWPQARENDNLFSLTLGAYISAGSAWKEKLGLEVLREFMLDFTADSDTMEGASSLLEMWIQHDKAHFEKAIGDSKFTTCKLDPTIFNIAQTVSDLLIATSSRIDPIRHDSPTFLTFTRDCIDSQLRDVVVHAFKVQARVGPKSDISRLRNSLAYILATMNEYDVGSHRIRQQFSNLSTQLD